ncbi:hypothetical protein D3C73_1154850 [compost metagenome]
MRHAVVAKLGDDLRVGKTGANGTVEHRQFAAIGRFCFSHDKGCTGHTLHPAGDKQFAFVTGHCAGGIDHRRQTTGAQAVNCLPRYGHGQACKQCGVTRDVAAVLPCLVGIAQNHVLDGFARDGVASEQFVDHMGGEVVWAYRSECAAVAAKWRAQSREDVGVEHGKILALRFSREWFVVTQ